jgi:hypothetical protein
VAARELIGYSLVWVIREGRSRASVRGALLALVLLAVLAPTAMAAQPKPGKWSGSLHGYPVTFKVLKGGHKVKNFTIQVMSVYCINVLGGPGSGQIETRTFYVPNAKIASDGTISGDYKTHASDGSVDGEMKLTGKFTGRRKAHGTANFSRTGCYGNENWSATGGGGGGKHHHPKSIKGAKYSGTTDQGHPLSIKVTSNGKKLKSFKISNIDEKCADGSTDSLNFTLGLSDHVKVDRKGRFSFTQKGKDDIALDGRVRPGKATGKIYVKSTLASTTCAAIVSFNLPRS